MKSTGIVRRLDKLGRVVLPMELRRVFGYEEREALEIFVEGEKIIIKSYKPLCIFCGSSDGLKSYRNKKICCECINQANDVLERN